MPLAKPETSIITVEVDAFSKTSLLDESYSLIVVFNPFKSPKSTVKLLDDVGLG